MRTLLIGALSATLISCSSPGPTQTNFGQTAARPTATWPALFTPPPTAKVAAKTERPASARRRPAQPMPVTTAKASPAQASDHTDPTEERADAPKTEGASPGKPAETADPVVKKAKISGRPADMADPVLKKAKVTVAAKMEDPASAEFGDMKRAIRKNTLGEPIDTICGRVKGRKPSGEDTGDRPFLYLVNEDEAFVVSGDADSELAIAYHNICN